jgi:hypothetical protein
MAPLKFENKIKETIEQRTIQPSAHAWDKLEAKLDESKKSWFSKNGWYLGIAASIIGVLLITFYNNTTKDDDIIPNETIVTIPESSPEETQEKVIEIETPQESVVAVAEKSVLEKAVTSPKKEGLNTKVKDNFEPKPEEKVNQAIASQTTEEKSKEDTLETSFEDLKVEEVVAQIQNLKETNAQVTNAEIDSLLTKAQEEIAQQRIFDSQTNTVNALTLLEDVEQDLDRSFRDKVFEALKDSYKNVRTAYANRNN